MHMILHCLLFLSTFLATIPTELHFKSLASWFLARVILYLHFLQLQFCNKEPKCIDIFWYQIAEWDPWGVPDDYECEVVENDAPVPKHVPLHRPGPLPEEFYKTLDAIMTGKLEPPAKKDESAIPASSQ